MNKSLFKAAGSAQKEKFADLLLTRFIHVIFADVHVTKLSQSAGMSWWWDVTFAHICYCCIRLLPFLIHFAFIGLNPTSRSPHLLLFLLFILNFDALHKAFVIPQLSLYLCCWLLTFERQLYFPQIRFRHLLVFEIPKLGSQCCRSQEEIIEMMCLTMLQKLLENCRAQEVESMCCRKRQNL